ncbi:hypothetical protein NECAME_16077 [Necator americanus]|uniref:Uncharacterized protein n=1 Tax=Necator americanus TaxID=51031 RepID=W2TXT6_NECAM|nr:hypothetical protein NECAME_16077 [Necator americanus]ETN86875.1 hypothetical protein NECAME_16077 [Necator americanus]
MSADSENAAAKFSVGKRFGEWVIVKKMDEGGFGQVYKQAAARRYSRSTQAEYSSKSFTPGSTHRPYIKTMI